MQRVKQIDRRRRLRGWLTLGLCTGVTACGAPGGPPDAGDVPDEGNQAPAPGADPGVSAGLGTNGADMAPSTGTTTSPTSDPEMPITTPDDGVGGPSDEGTVPIDPSTLPDGVPPATQAWRLTYDEYDRAVSDLVHLELAPSKLFPSAQPTLDGYYDRPSLRVTERLHDELVRVAEDVAAQLVTTPPAYAQVVSCEAVGASCRDSFLRDFGLRAFRRPLTSSELARYQELFDSAAMLVQSGDPFADGVQLTVEAMLQSPNFLYRIERGEAGADAVGVPLTDYEIAARLSFMLLGTGPDAELLSEATAGSLSTPEQISTQAERLVARPELAERVIDFHDRWLALDALVGTEKDPAKFPAFSPALTAAMRAETQRFVQDVTLDGGGAIAQLLTASHTFVNAELAALYGIPGSFGSELTRVELDGGVRGGLFTQGSFLAGHASSSTLTSPILRGIFVLRRVLCQSIPEPPPDATQQEPPASETPIVTTREFFAWKTSMPACVGCHSFINPVGFAFEGFDAIGAARSMENGAPVDTTGSVTLAGQAFSFDGPRDLVAHLAKLPEVHACYARHWLQYAYGRRDTSHDQRTIGVIAQRLGTDGYGVRELLVDLTRSAAFSHLAASE